MPRRTEKQTIDGIEYTTKTLGGEAGFRCWKRLLKVIGSGGMRLLLMSPEEKDRAIKKGITPEQLESQISGAILDHVIERVEEIDLGFVKELLSETRAPVHLAGAEKPLSDQNVADHFDEHFAGRPMHLTNVLQFVIRHNFSGPTGG